MPVNLSIKNVPDDVAQALRERAVRNHRSLQGELMAVLTEAARRGYGSGLEPLVTRNPITVEEAVKRVKGLFPGGTESSVEFIRRDRDERAGEC
jgi:plasmid stability protein